MIDVRIRTFCSNAILKRPKEQRRGDGSAMILEFRHRLPDVLCLFPGDPRVKLRIRFHAAVENCDPDVTIDRSLLRQAGK